MKTSFLHRLLTSLCLLTLAACGERATHEREPEVRALIDTYFKTWSAQDMDGYGRCFHPDARVTYLPDGGKNPRTDSLTDFLYGQRMGHKTSPDKMVEIPTAVEVQMDDRGAQALVRWELTKGGSVTTGTDLFNLIRTPEGWRIINLVFYSD